MQGAGSEPFRPNARLPEIHDVTRGWYQSWYFELRLEEEVYRAERHGLSLTVAAVRLDSKWDPDGEESLSLLNSAAAQLRRSDLPAIMGPDQLAVCLTHTTLEEAEPVMQRLVALLAGFGPRYGLAVVSPGESARNLLERAQRSAGKAAGG